MGHVMYLGGYFKSSYPVNMNLWGSHHYSTEGSGEYEYFNDIIVRNDYNTILFIGSEVGSEVTSKQLIAIDLTKMFGSDAGIVSALGLSSVDEITTDKAIVAFESLFPQSYYANHGKDICFVSRYLLLYNIRNQFKS